MEPDFAIIKQETAGNRVELEHFVPDSAGRRRKRQRMLSILQLRHIGKGWNSAQTA